MSDVPSMGFYGMKQLCSRQETENVKGNMGIFPWSRMTILRMIDAGEFPAPIKGPGHQRLWPKEIIHEYIEKIKGENQK